ncbi:MAG: hypothetical protein COW88_02830 [Candidatus Lloydbacteria bacterium CG22_combo_CG10-13_8_21_14_all_47_15]|uniref:Uncharacterized protein n=1 Tax=Candidatus Lloydbacteria bacterium CG22_combo_CG10-13_8_21_14_all_47_15 TaxID=1974635 RepID=A0A2H0CTT0_9BACT|nr:MAG: hypothetical protein COW88_02830 [Candidatus Lloydbacteria bacterium CG22_combo_CG10-13_8_21_14_all_47_15]
MHSKGYAPNLLPFWVRISIVAICILGALWLVLPDVPEDTVKDTLRPGLYVAPKHVETRTITIYPDRWSVWIDIPPGVWWKFESIQKESLIMRRFDGKIITIAKNEIKWLGDNIPASSFQLKSGTKESQEVVITFEKK